MCVCVATHGKAECSHVRLLALTVCAFATKFIGLNCFKGFNCACTVDAAANTHTHTPIHAHKPLQSIPTSMCRGALLLLLYLLALRNCVTAFAICCTQTTHNNIVAVLIVAIG